MTAAAAAERGRRLAESLMTATCTIRGEAVGKPTTDPESGKVTPPESPVIYAGRCRVRPAGTQQDPMESGGAEVFTFDYQVTVPFFVTTVIEGMSCRIDTSPDGALVGLELEVQQVARGDHITARRLACKEVS